MKEKYRAESLDCIHWKAAILVEFPNSPPFYAPITISPVFKCPDAAIRWAKTVWEGKQS